MAEEQDTGLDELGYDKPHEMTKVKHIIGVVSGKGGVGKSLVTSLMSAAANKAGNKVGVFDGDITGPSIPRSFGLKGPVHASPQGILPITSPTGIEVMSANFVLPSEDTPVIWRGPVLAQVVKQFWQEVVWGELDYMFIDMPPGTGDVPLTVFQSMPIDGIVIVTSPQELVSMIVKKAVNMAEDMGVPVLGLVENFSYFECPDCGKKHQIYGESHVDEVAEQFGIDLVAKLPIRPEIAAMVDAGKVEEVEVPELAEFMAKVAEKAASLPARKSPFLVAQERRQAELDAKLDAAVGPKIEQ